MHFLRFVIGGFLILVSILLFISLVFSMPFVIVSGAGWSLVFWGIIDFIAFLGGIYLVIHH